MEPSPAIEAQVRRHVDERERFFDRITACHVVIEQPHRHHRQGRLYHIGIVLEVPGREITVQREPSEHQAHEGIQVAIHDAFDAARRQLQDYVRVRRADIKTHEQPTIGRIATLFAECDYAFLVTESSDEVYVHRNAVLGRGFDQLRIGDKVRYVLDEKASTARKRAPSFRCEH